MKKGNLIFFIFLSINSLFYSQKIEATVYLSNGTSKSGLADYVDFSTKEIKYRADKNSDKEKIKTEDIKKIIYNGEKNDERKIAENIGNYWFYKIHEGEVSLYIIVQKSYDPGSGIRDASASYYVTYKDDVSTMKPIMTIMTNNPIGINIGKKKMTLAMVKGFFSDKCPKLVEAFENDNIKVKRDPFPIIEYYEKNCQSSK